ncbi:MAG TPA: DNA polymerase III subunit beta [Thermomicrobiales bacterium]|nr:DNA polymerase III subunit beta [Thermomicrobiales bacterium]
MRVTCLQQDLQRALSITGRAVASRTTLPVLSNYLIEAEEDALTVSATNLELGITCRIPARVDEPGKAALQARVLNDFVSSLSSGEVQLYEDSGPTTMLVKQGATQAHVRGQDPDEFPAVTPESTPAAALTVDSGLLSEAIAQVVFAAATDDSRPVLAGVHIESEGTKLALAAADGFRMSFREMDIGRELENDISIVVPARSMQEIARIIADSEEPAEISITPNQAQMIVSIPDITVVTRLIDGTFPDLKQIIPQEWNTRTVVSREVLLDAARRAAIFARSNNDVVKFALEPAGGADGIGRMTITATAADTGDNRDDLDAQVEGSELEVAFNGRYLTDVLSVLGSPSVALELQGPNAAGVFKPVDDDSFVHVIMPMVIGAN